MRHDLGEMHSMFNDPSVHRHWLDFMIVPSKFELPELPEGYVKRTRLDKKLQGAHQRRLTVIVGPPGSGKTTLISGWAGSHSSPVASITLEEADNHLLRFWLQVIAALQRVTPGLDAGLTERFIEQFMQQPGRALSELINEFSKLSAPVTLVLENYHVIEMDEIHSMLTEWIKNMPPHLHLVLVSRIEVKLKLPKSAMYRIAWPSLAFTPAEARRFCHSLKLRISNQQLENLMVQTEGWALGLRMLGTSGWSEEQSSEAMPNQTELQLDSKADHITVCSRMMDKVMLRLSQDAVAFLLRTSIPERINEELCKELAGTDQTAGLLAELERENLFFQRVSDANGTWYKYHPLIAQKLRDMLHREDARLWRSLQRITGRWLEDSHYPMEAMEHYLKGECYDEAGRLLEVLFNQFILQEAWTLRSFFSRIPEEIIQTRPKLYLSFLFFAASEQDPARTLEQLDSVERRIASGEGGLSANKREYSMRVIKVMRAYVCIFKGDLEGLAYHLNDYLDIGFSPTDEIFTYIDYEMHHFSRLRSFPGITGYLQQAEKGFDPIMARWQNIRCYNTAYYAIGYAELLYERNRLRESETFAELAISIGEELEQPALMVPAAIVQSRIDYGRNRFHQAVQGIRDISQRLKGKESQYWMPILDACETKLQLQSPEGEADAGARYLKAYPKPPAELRGCNEMLCALVYARALISIEQDGEARALLKQIQKQSAEQGRLMEQLESHVLLALLYAKQNKATLASRTFGKAVLLSGAEGHLRIYIDEGEDLRRIAEHYRQTRHDYKTEERQVSVRYIDQILFAFEAQSSAGGQASDIGRNPLSAMEREVLRGVSRSCSSKEIAASLGVSTGTVNTYIQRIFTKLEVNKRKDAVLTAYRLGWLDQE